MKIIRQITSFFIFIIIFLSVGLSLIFNRIQAMDVAHHRLIQEWRELRVILELVDKIDRFTAYISISPDNKITREKVNSFIEAISINLEEVRNESFKLETFEESSHLDVEREDFLKIYQEYQNFLVNFPGANEQLLNEAKVRDELINQLENLRSAAIDLQSFYVQGMGEASQYAQRIRYQIFQRIVGTALVLLIALSLLAALFIHLIQKSMQAMIDREKGLTIGLTAQSLAHEIRNPLSIIKSSASVIKEKLPAKSEERELADYLVDESQRISEMIEQLLHLNKSRHLELGREDLGSIIEEVGRLLIGACKKANVHLEIENKLGKAIVSAARNELKQVFINILLNAIQASPSGGRVRVSCFVRNVHAVVEVSDSGSGFSPDVIKRAFEPFYTTKNSGSGLGLFIAKQILEHHHGTIEIGGSTSGGARVIISLPMLREESNA